MSRSGKSKLAHTHQHQAPSPQDMASAGTNLQSCGSCPVPAHLYLSRTECGSQWLPTNLPTCQACQPGSRMRRRLAKKGGGGGCLRCKINPACQLQTQSGRHIDTSCTGQDRRQWTPKVFKVGRHGVRAMQEQQGWGWGIGPCSIQSRSDLPNPCTYRNMSSIPPRDPLCPSQAPAGQHAAACRVSLAALGSPPS